MTSETRSGTTGKAGQVIWICGLSGSGKSTVTGRLVRLLREAGTWCASLDGDEMRAVFGTDTPASQTYDRSARLALGFQYARLGRLLAEQGTTAVVATISLFRELHDWNRANLPGYFEVYLKVPLAELRRRDPKGIYRRFDSGELHNVAGLDVPVDEPRSPDLLIEHTPGASAEAIAKQIFSRVRLL